MTNRKKPTQTEEDEFMKNLLSEIHDTPPVATPPPTHDTNSSGEHPSRNSAKTREFQKVERSKIEKLSTLEDSIELDLKTLFDGAESWDWNDMEVDVQELTQSDHLLSPKRIPTPCARCKVLDVHSDPDKKHLLVTIDDESNSQSRREVILEREWVQTEIIIGDVVNIIGEWNSPIMTSVFPSNPVLTITIDSKSNLLILHPDLLLSATTVSNAPSCTRKPLLSLMLSSNAPVPFKGTTDDASVRISPDEFFVWGNFLHEIMQKCLVSGQWDNQSVEDKIDEVVRSSTGLSELVKLRLGIETAKTEIRARAGGLAEFSKRFIGPSVKPEGKLNDIHHPKDCTSRLTITDLYEVEEEIWSPTYGLKGKIDASVKTLVLEESSKNITQTHNWTLPLEIKTGRSVNVMEHRAQTMLYTLLMAERYGDYIKSSSDLLDLIIADLQVPSGLLFYTHSEELLNIAATKNEMKALIMTRNELASYLRRKRVLNSRESHGKTGPILPASLDDSYRCNKCYVVDGCMLYRKAVENVNDFTSPIAELYAKKTSHLTQAHCDFFKQWEALVSMEEQDVVRFRKELWTMSAEEREKRGRCFAHMVVQGYSQNTSPGVARIQHVYCFIRASNSSPNIISTSTQLPDGSFSLLNGAISVGDAVTISVDPDLIGVARGYVVELEPSHIKVGFDHEVDLRGILKRTRPTRTIPEPVICRIDKDEFGGGLGRIRDNLARLFYVNGDTKRLSLIVDLSPPAFDEDDIIGESDIPPHLNINQKAAVRKVLSAKDYAVILGMPGTGKTSTIAEVINALVKSGKTVLLTSYTHSAVDTILLKLKDVEYPILRLGSVEKVHPDIHKFTLACQPQPTTIEQLEHQILRPPVVATTCLSVDHPLFARRYFDYCIVDEASQVTLPTCLGPLRYADRFVLVGDHFQLPPLVRSKDARLGGLDISLFRRLVEAHPEAIVDLVDQYRMNSDIMLLANTLIYSNRLRCASEEIANRGLTLPNRSALKAWCKERICLGSCWLSSILDESRKVVFIDTDALPGLESHVGDLVQNEFEAKLVCQVTDALLACGISGSQIGIISLYRQQIKLLSHLLHMHKDIEFLTADRSQGRDKDCVIISMVKSNASGQTGDLMKDWRRINVSLTRAKSKLVIFGSRSTLRGAPVLAQFFEILERKSWIYSLTPGAHQFHEKITVTPKVLEESIKPAKRRAPDIELNSNKENLRGGPIHKKAKTKLDQGILKGRPLIRDIVNDLS